jgi:peptide/nickel transport system substrate-binding protein
MNVRPLVATRRALIAIAALALGAGLPAIGTAREAGTLVVAQSSDALTLDPSLDTSPISLNLFKNIYDQLTDIASDGSVGPLLATSWQASSDATVWTFTIRTDARFHDGSPVTADDVVWSFQKIRADAKSPVQAYLTSVKAVEKVADDKVRFTLTAPFAPFDRQVSLISILPRKAYEERGASFAQSPVGSGPFKVVRWVKDDRIELESFAGYFGGAPKIKKLIFRPVPSESARAAALSSGELDIVPILPPALIPALEAKRDIKIERVASNRILYLGFDVTNPVLASEKLRQAINHAIDRNAIVTRLLRGLGKPEGQIVAPVTFGYDASVKPAAYDTELAKHLVQESGYTGAPIPFQYPNNRYAFGQEVAQAVAGYLQAVGIKVDLQGMEYSAFFPRWTGRKLNAMHMFAFGPSIMDAELPLRSLYETGPARAYWSSPEVNRLIVAQRAEADPAKRKGLIGQVWKLSQQHVPYAILYNEIQAYGIRDGVKWRPRPDERLLFHSAEVSP